MQKKPLGYPNWSVFTRILPTPAFSTSGPCRVEPSLGTHTWNLGTSSNLHLDFRNLLGTSEALGTFTWNPYLEPRNLPEPSLGTLTWNLRTSRDDCPRVPQGWVWLRPQSFQLLGKNNDDILEDIEAYKRPCAEKEVFGPLSKWESQKQRSLRGQQQIT